MHRHIEANLLALIESTEDLWGSVDANYRLLVFNKNFQRYIQDNFGVQVAVGMGPAEILPQDRVELWPRLFDRAIKEGAFRTEQKLLNGRILEMAFHPILVDGKPQGVTVYGKDISDRKIAERRLSEAQIALRQSEERHRVAFQTSPNAVNIIRLYDGMVLDVNQTFLDAMGIEREEIAGRTAWELKIWVDPGDLQKIVETLRLYHLYRGDIQLKKKNGETFWGRMSASVFDHDGVPCVLTVTQDISDAKASEQKLVTAQEELRASEERYRIAFHTSLDGFAIIRASDSAFVDMNQALVDALGYQRQELLGRSPTDLNLWADAGEREKLMQALRKDAICRNFEARFRKKDGQTLWGLISASLIEADGQTCFLAQVRDVSEARAAEESMAAAADALRVSEERYRTAFETSLDGIGLTHLEDGLFVDINPAFLRIFGFRRDEVVLHTSLELNIWADPNQRQKMVNVLHSKSVCHNMEVQFQRKNGQCFWAQLSASKVDLDGIPSILVVMRDNSEARAAEQKIENLAFYDPMTRLPNRRQLLDRLHQILAVGNHGNHKLALLLVDLDNFKTLNDTLGHQAGDQLLQEVAKRITTKVRETDFVARLGGDEFIVILEEMGEASDHAVEQAKIVGEKLLAAIAQPYHLNGRVCLSTASIGIAIFGDRRDETTEVLKQADIAMDQAKAAGRNTLRFFSPALGAAISARAALEEDLRQAIGSKHFLLYYQPQVIRGRVVGAEALIRWQHPSRGIVPPDMFIPLAEETGLILPLGDWVLETACAQIAAWAREKNTDHLSIAVNISARQFRQPEFEQKVLAALKRTGADPRNLKLELTESMLLENVEEVIAKMTNLRSREIGFSLDDFGTGYSSLAYLKRLPLDQLKIDRTFVRDILTDASSGAIAEAIISLGKAMGMPVIAEGVETEEQRAFLARLGCHAFQGYLASRPLPLDDFQSLLKALAKISVPYAD
jgi:diguanylate cyclase (GGDEF)-like protein/PAS domain S-box-containing protein